MYVFYFLFTEGVAGTPWYFINGVSVDAAAWNVQQWQAFLDELLKNRHILATV